MEAVRQKTTQSYARAVGEAPANWDNRPCGYYFCGMYGEKPVWCSEEGDEMQNLVELSRQIDELDYEFGEMEDGADYAINSACESPNQYPAEFRPGQWVFKGRRWESQEALHFHLVEVCALGEEDAEWMPEPVAFRTPTAHEIAIASNLGLDVSITPTTTKFGNIELSGGLYYVFIPFGGDTQHLTLLQALEAGLFCDTWPECAPEEGYS